MTKNGFTSKGLASMLLAEIHATSEQLGSLSHP